MQSKILITGGAGYIGSHTVLNLIRTGKDVLIYDNFSNSKLEVLDRIKKDTSVKPDFVNADIKDSEALGKVFRKFKISAVIHFAALKSVPESEANPLDYYENNVAGSINLLNEMKKVNLKKIIFSSTAAVYDLKDKSRACKEDDILNPASVYGKTKLMTENILKDLKRSDQKWNIVILRYFNPIGADILTCIGEDSISEIKSIIQSIIAVAKKKKKILSIFGNDYNTKDGTALRDYIHIDDLAKGHIAALPLLDLNKVDPYIINLGRGVPCSVLELVKIFENVNKVEIPYEFKQRRKGDIESAYADTTLANSLLNWRSEYDIAKACEDSWRWEQNR